MTSNHEFTLKLETEDTSTGALALINANVCVEWDAEYATLNIESVINENDGRTIEIGRHERKQICDEVARLLKVAKEEC